MEIKNMKKVNNIRIEELGNRVVVESADGCRTEIHFDEDGNQEHTFIDTKADSYKTKVHTFKQGGYNHRKIFVYNETDGWSDKRRVMFVDNK